LHKKFNLPDSFFFYVQRSTIIMHCIQGRR